MATTCVWNLGGTWSSDAAGVQFDVDARHSAGVDKNMPVNIVEGPRSDRIGVLRSDRVDDGDGGRGGLGEGFMRGGWMAKANARYGRLGPVSLFAVNRQEKAVAVFIGKRGGADGSSSG